MGIEVPWTIRNRSVIKDAFAKYAEHRTGTEMQRLLHHGHWIPVLRGYTAAYVAEHFPGWSWNSLLDGCRAADIINPDTGRGAPLSCDPRVRTFHFTSKRVFAVEWDDGTVSMRPRT